MSSHDDVWRARVRDGLIFAEKRRELEMQKRFQKLVQKFPDLKWGSSVQILDKIEDFIELQKNIHAACWVGCHLGESAEFVSEVIHRYVLDVIERMFTSAGLYPAQHFRDKYGIPADRLRQAKRRGKIQSVQVLNETRYFECEVRVQWPEDFA